MGKLYQKMIGKLYEIATAAIKGGGALTDKLISAQNAVEHNREEARKPKNMTYEEKHEFIKNI